MNSIPAPLPDSSEVEYVIEPNRAWVKIHWAELLEYRDLLFLLVRRDVVSKYKQTILGPLWHLIHPLVMALVFTAVFSRVAAISTGGAPRVLFYLSGLLAWNYFSQNLQSIAGTFTSNATLFGKVYFPRLIIPLAVIISNLVAITLQFGIFVLFFLGYKVFTDGDGFHMGWSLLLWPLLVAQNAMLSLGVGLWLSALTAKYRDLHHALPFFISICMFASPLFYPIAEISPASRWIFLLNPLAPLMEAYRRVLLGIGTVEPFALGLSLAVTLVVLLGGLALFQRTERTAVDTL